MAKIMVAQLLLPVHDGVNLMAGKIKRAPIRGFALMEVMIAMFVLAVGILGAGAMQTIGLQANRGAYMRSQAVLLAGDMLDRIRANRKAKASYLAIDTNDTIVQALATPGCVSTAAGCAYSDLATADIVAWRNMIRSRDYLPGGRGEITSLATGDNVQIRISWGETDWSAGVRSNQTMTYNLVAAVNLGDH